MESHSRLRRGRLGVHGEDVVLSFLFVFDELPDVLILLHLSLIRLEDVPLSYSCMDRDALSLRENTVSTCATQRRLKRSRMD